MDDQTLKDQVRLLWEHNLDSPALPRPRRRVPLLLMAAAATVIVAIGGALLVLRDGGPDETGIATERGETLDDPADVPIEFPQFFQVETSVDVGELDLTLVDGTERTLVFTDDTFDRATVSVALWFEEPSRSYVPVYGSGPEELAEALCENDRVASEQCLTQQLSESDPRIAMVGPAGRLFHVFGATEPAGSFSWQVIGTDTTEIEAQYENVDAGLTDAGWLTLDPVPDGLDLAGVEYQVSLHEAGTDDTTELVVSVRCDEQITESLRRYLVNNDGPGDVGDYECVDRHRISGPGASAVARIDDPTVDEAPAEDLQPGDEQLIADFLDLADNPSAELLAALPLAPEVQLGLGQVLHETVAAPALADSTAWSLDVENYAALEGPFSALEVAAGAGPTKVSAGPHPHCAGPPRPAPPAVTDLRRVSVQPADETIDSCLSWWTVDFFLDDGVIQAITLDLWEP